MINQSNTQSILSCPLMNMPNQEAKNIIVSPSLMMRLLEWASEQGDNDMVLHQALENMMSFTDGVNPLKIDCFNVIVPEASNETVSCQTVEQDYPCASEEDISCANELGQCLANAGVDISNVPYSDVAPIIIQARDDKDLEGYGASNHEIESFWDGYESVEPLEMACSEEGCCPCEQCCQDESIDNDLQAEIDNIINSCIG